MSSFKNIAVIGASGNIGKIILDGLIASAKFTVTVISRQDSNAIFPAGVTVRKTDFTMEDLNTALKGQDVVISALGAAAFGEQQKIVDAAVHAGVKRFLPSEFSASSQDPAVLQLLPLFNQKKALIEYLESKEAEGLTWTGLATGPLFDWCLRTAFLEFDITKHTATIWDGGNKKFTLTNEKQLGEAVVSILDHPQETTNRYFYVYTVHASQNEILASLEEATGAKWTVNSTTTEEQISEGVKKFSAGDITGAFTLVRATTFGNTSGLRSDYTKEERLANGILGLRTETVQETVNRVLSE